jgi:23S rRNA pseudouridine1911/1915/1917 synthase
VLDKFSLLEIGLETGRTHQIRVHLAWLGCPVVGDAVYGRKKSPVGVSRQFLHAWKLGLRHPRTGEWLEFEAPLPADLQAVLNQLQAET